jgi:hypothetical protein
MEERGGERRRPWFRGSKREILFRRILSSLKGEGM